MAFSTNI